jgi:hypothetical protein
MASPRPDHADDPVSPRYRILSFGSAGALVLAGALCAVFVNGEVGQLLALVLIGVGFIVATGLVFLEVGLSEDRELAREHRARRPRRPERTPRPKLERSRGHRRRLS